MALDTRGVLAVAAGLLMIAALVAARTERRLLGTWMMMIGFGVASLYSIMSIFWAQSNPSALSPRLWISMSSIAVVATIYYGYMGLWGEGIGE